MPNSRNYKAAASILRKYCEANGIPVDENGCVDDEGLYELCLAFGISTEDMGRIPPFRREQ